MKTVTLHLDEDVYGRYQREARLRKRSASALIREAMGMYLAELSPPEQPSLLDEVEPASVGRVLDLPGNRADLLDDFLEPR
jgi:hypothetical protein